MRLAPAIVAVALARAAFAIGTFQDSPYHEPIPDYGSCDVVVTPANFATTLGQSSLNDGTKSVFCFEPGDYRAAGELQLWTSGTQQRRRFLRFNSDDGARNALLRGSSRALIESVKIMGSWWVVEGLTIQPKLGLTAWFVTIYGGDHLILAGNVIDGIDHTPLAATQNALVVSGYQGDPATYNTVQDNVIRNGNQGKRPGDFDGVIIVWGKTSTEKNDFNKVLDNEIYDWGVGVTVAGHTNCSEPAAQRGTIIDGNDVYITANKRIDCDTGAPNPDGDCSCAGEGISKKLDPGSDAASWTRITNNRLWGFRPTSDTVSCGGSGANGQAITSGNDCSARVIAANNVIQDATVGIVPSHDWIVAGNLIEQIRMSNGDPWTSLAIDPDPIGNDIDIQFNTVVGADSAYDDQSVDTDTRCNALIDVIGMKGAGLPPPPTHLTRYNYLYKASSQNFTGSTNVSFATASSSQNGDYCFWRKRWTEPQYVCIPQGSTTAASPHVAAAGNCNEQIGAPWGITPITWPTTVPCNDGSDNDGDGLVDFPEDPGCASATATTENPACQNGIDDDGDGLMDFDGGASWNGGTWIEGNDPVCKSAHLGNEKGSCGLGAEVAGVLLLLRRTRKWKARAAQRTSS